MICRECGCVMYPTKKRPKQGHVTYKCFHCKRTEKRYTNGNPWKPQIKKPLPIEFEPPEILKSTVLDEIEEVIRGLIMEEDYLKKLEDEIY